MPAIAAVIGTTTTSVATYVVEQDVRREGDGTNAVEKRQQRNRKSG